MKRVPIRRLSALLLAGAAGVAVAGLPSRPAMAQVTSRTRGGTAAPGSMGIPQPEPKINLTISQKSLGRILSEIFKQAPYKYQVLAELGTTVFSLDVKDVPLAQALQMLLAQDKSEEPLVFSFTPNAVGGGLFTIDREIIDVGLIEGENRVSAANARITRVLPKVFEMMKVKYRIEPDVPPVLVSLQLHPEDWSQVVPQVIIEAEKAEPTLTYSIDNDNTYVVFVQKTPPNGTPGMPARKAELSVNNVPLKAAVEQLFKDSTWKPQVSDKVANLKVTYNNANETELGALRSLLRAASTTSIQATYREGKDNILYIEPGALPGDVRVAARAKVMRGTVSVNSNGQLLRTITDSIERQAGAKIVVPKAIPNIPVTMKVTDVQIEDALQALIEAVGASIPNLQFKAVGKEYQLILAAPAPK